ncbi:porin [Myroides sp. WP-1]|uniref:porin n=1 Tax=Myroides sp. WP-1 TaxID=2759944 RepID=UPI0015FCB15B|nr:porin [Myroides sp. WP-1]MBB1140853.1 hypothetical protein [Myroides sp. WP-1]
MKRLISLVMIGMSSFVFGQQSKTNDSLPPLIPTTKQGLIKDFDVRFYVRSGFDANFEENKLQTSRFFADELRIDMKAKLHERVSVRFRHRFNTKPVPGTLDKMSSAVNLAFIEVQALPKMSVSFGKLGADWGGYEYDLNAIEILAYNDILSRAENYLVGLGIAYQVHDKHRFNFQLLNASANKLDEVGEFAMPKGSEVSKTPYAFVGNWRGSFWNDKFQTSYSYSYFTQAKNRAMQYIALGNKYESGRLTWMYDFQYSHNGIDKNGIISSMFAAEEPELLESVSYIDHWTRIDYKVLTNFCLSLTLMTSNGYAKNITATNEGYSHLRKSYGIIPMLQYRPFKKVDLRFFAAYVGRWYNYSSYAKENLNQHNYSTGRIALGLIAPLNVF